MFQIAIVFNNTNANISLSYKTWDVAVEHWNSILKNRGMPYDFLEYDDFGHLVSLKPATISYVLFMDMEQAQIAKYEQDICLRRAEKTLIERMNSTPDERQLFPTENAQPHRPASKIIQ